MTVRILDGDVRERLRDLPDASVQCCVTSPPYYGLRDYGVLGQLGLEPTLAEYIARMVEVFRDVRRVLRDDGVLWLNIGDSYNAYNANRGKSNGISGHADVARRFFGGSEGDLLRTDSDGAGDFPRHRRRGKARSGSGGLHELERGLTEPCLKPKDLMMVPARLAIALQDDGWYLRSDIIWHKPNPMPESVTDRPTSAHEHIFLLTRSRRYYYDADAIGERSVTVGDTRHLRTDNTQEFGRGGDDSRMRTGNPTGEFRNARNVWSIATMPYKEAHFATFPPELPRRCILAGSREGDTVLDPFLGSGTTLLVADRLGREGIGIELNPTYAAMARRRIEADCPMFAEVCA